MRQLRDRGKDGRDVSCERVILAVALRFPLTIFLKLVDTDAKIWIGPCVGSFMLRVPSENKY